jgi:hypothetical protein
VNPCIYPSVLNSHTAVDAEVEDRRELKKLTR